MDTPLPRVSHPGPLREVKPLSDEELRGLRKFFSLELEAHQAGVIQREMSEGRAELILQIQTLQREMESREINIRDPHERDRDRVAYQRRIAVMALRREMIEDVLGKIGPRADGLRDQRDHVAKALLSIGTLTQQEIEGT